MFIKQWESLQLKKETHVRTALPSGPKLHKRREDLDDARIWARTLSAISDDRLDSDFGLMVTVSPSWTPFPDRML